MFKKIKDTFSRLLFGEKLFDLGTVLKDVRGKNDYTEVTMSINRKKKGRFIILGIKERHVRSTNLNWLRLYNFDEIRKLRIACDRIDALLSIDLSDEELKSLNNEFPETPAK